MLNAYNRPWMVVNNICCVYMYVCLAIIVKLLEVHQRL